MTNHVALPSGTELAGDFRIDRVLGAGGFGITYLAHDKALNCLVTVKEYFPSEFAVRAEAGDAGPRSLDCAGDYRWGLDRFIEEARALAKFRHPNIVRVSRYFLANSTGYMVLDFESGSSLKGWLKDLGRAPRQKELDAIVAPLLDALEAIHKAGFLHRDIAPDNIIIRKDGTPVLIDFGSARGEMAAHSRTVSALVKPGYSPYEQYAETSRQQGPWTDIYALGATLYHAISGKRPPDAPSRNLQDDLVPAREAALSSYRPGFLRAIDRALAMPIEARPQSIAAWRGDLLAPEPAKPGWLTRALERKREEPRNEGFAFPFGRSTETAVPPPPDAPGPKGGLIDFLERLKHKNTRPALEPAGETLASAAGHHEPDPEPLEPPRPPPRVLAGRGKPPRPRPLQNSGGVRLRPLLVKLLIGAGIASAIVAMQDSLPRMESRGGAVPASQTEQIAQFAALRGHAGPVTSVVYSADGRSIVTAGADATIRIWESSGGLTRTIELDDGPATAIALSGDRVLTGHGDGQIVLWDLNRAEKLSTFRRNEANVWSLTFAGDPDRFAASGHDWKVALWDVRLKEGPVHVFEGHENAAQATAYSRRGPHLATGGADRTVKLWNLDTLELVRTYRGHRDFVSAVAFSPEGQLLASASLDGTVRLWRTESHRAMRTLRGHRGRVNAVAFSPDGAILASAGEDGMVRLWDTRRGRTLRTLAGHAGPVRGLAFSPDGDRIASASDDGSVRLWTPSLLRRASPRETN